MPKFKMRVKDRSKKGYNFVIRISQNKVEDKYSEVIRKYRRFSKLERMKKGVVNYG